MKISYNWIREILDIDAAKVGVEAVADLLTMSGSEVEAIEKKGFNLSGIVAGKILQVRPHSQADRLVVCTVDVGSDRHEVVSGAPNARQGLSVIFAGVGATIASGQVLTREEIRGVESSGMVLAEDELGISNDHSGVIELENSILPGTPVKEFLPLEDHILELEITPNRPDCLSHIGIARELKALLGVHTKYPDFSVEESGPEIAHDLTIEIADPDGCPRYTGRLVSEVHVAPSPLWLKARLFYLGVRPINNVVDITNHVLLETGHPLHAFDYSRFRSKKVLVRRARSGERFVTLDGAERTLNDGQLLITNGHEAVALAGIMGGLDSEVTDTTASVLLESAYFDPVSIRRGARAVGLSTESSQRFERGADPLMAPKANDRACSLVARLAGGKVHRGMVDAYPKKFVPVEISFRPRRARMLLAGEISDTEMQSIFRGLDIDVLPGDSFKVVQPSFRPDLTREVDLIEEVGRIYGLDRIAEWYRPGGKLGVEVSPQVMVESKLRDFLVGRGFVETFSSTLVEAGQLVSIHGDVNLVRLQNPLSEELSALRPDLIISMLRSLRHNVNHGNKDLRLYEIGARYRPSRERGDFAEETRLLCLGVSGREQPITWRYKEKFVDFYSLRGELEVLFEFFGVGTFGLRPYANPYFEDEVCFIVENRDLQLGVMGKLSVKAAKWLGLKQESYAAEIDLQKFGELAARSQHFEPLPVFPAADRDMAVIVDEALPAIEILKAIRGVGGDLVEDAFPFDIYRGGTMPEGKKSIALRIIYRSREGTLTDEEVDSAHQRVVERVVGQFKATLRA